MEQLAEVRPVRPAIPFRVFSDVPRNVYWEVTIACDLACKHCRAEAQPGAHPEELTTAEGKALIDDIKDMKSLLILTGGDPMKRKDLYELIEYGRNLHVPMAITPSTTPTLGREEVRRFKELGMTALGVSLDGPTPEIHDAFRGVPGTFERSMKALDWAREFDLPVQINTTVTTATLPYLDAIHDLLVERAAPPVRRWSLFLLVPVGRGQMLGNPTARQVENLFEWVYEKGVNAPFHMGTVEAPHYRRFWVEKKLAEGMPLDAILAQGGRQGLGIRDGNGIIFVSHRGKVSPAGFLPMDVGDVREQKLSEIYRTSPELLRLREMDTLGGKCGRCQYRWVCGGSRARAYGMTGDPMGEDPFCVFEA